MSFYRINKREQFTQIDNRMITDNAITAKAKGIMVYLLSKPDGWKVYEVDIINNMKDGRDSIRGGLKELVDNGYINRQQTVGKDGKFGGYEYEVYECKYDNPKFNSRDGKTVTGKSVDGKTDNGKPATSNTNLINTKLSNTNLKDIVEPTAQQHDIQGIINYLNSKANKKFKANTQATKSLIQARLKEYTLQDVKYVIDNKTAEWIDTDMAKYLRPSTLFNATNFENYVNEPPYQPKQNNNTFAAESIMRMALEERNEEYAKERSLTNDSNDTDLLPF